MTPANPNDYNGGNRPTDGGKNPIANNTVLNVNYSNNDSAVFVAGNTTFALNTIQEAVPLLNQAQTLVLDPKNTNAQGSSDWASGYAGTNPNMMVPEPGTLSLIALSGIALLRRRARR